MSIIGSIGFRVQVVNQPGTDNTDPASKSNNGPDGAVDSNSSIANSVASAAAQRVASTSVLSASQTINTQGSEAVLILDEFRAHFTEMVTNEYASNKVEQLVIPGGYTSSLQAIDVSVNKPLSDRYEFYWNNG